MSTIFKTRISQQEVQAPTISADRVVADNFLTSSIQSESVASESINATTVQGEEIIANDLSTENIAISNDLSIGQDVIVPSGNVLVGRKGIVSFVDDGEEVDENGASGFPIYNGVPEVLNNSTVYNIGEIDKDIDLSNIRFGGNDNMVQTCEIWLSTPANTTRSAGDTYEITWPKNVVWLDSTDGNAPAIVKGTEYRIVLRKENEQIVASIAYAIGEGQQSVDELIRDAAQKDGDNTFTGANTFTGSVDMSGASVTPPSGWNVEGVTAEEVQAVTPIAWGEVTVKPSAGTGNSLALGHNAKSDFSSLAIGSDVSATGPGSTAIGRTMETNGLYGLAIGYTSRANASYAISIGNGCAADYEKSMSIGSGCVTSKTRALTLGMNFSETVNGQNVSHTCQTQGTGSITIGAGANTKNPTNADGTPVLDSEGKPKESSNSVTIGCKAENKGADSVAIGAQANNKAAGNVVIGTEAKATADNSVAVGNSAEAKGLAVAVGRDSTAVYTGTAVGSNSSSTGAGFAGGFQASAVASSVAIGGNANVAADKSVAIGKIATITNTGSTQSENATVIGYGATASAPNAVVMGAGANTSATGGVAMGAGATLNAVSTGAVSIGRGASSGGQYAVAVGQGASSLNIASLSMGYNSKALGHSDIAIGNQTVTEGWNVVALGARAKANKRASIAIGADAQVSDLGATVIRSTAEDGTYTQLYFSGANTPLANTYTNGEALMGFVTVDKDGNPVASGYKRLSAIFDEGSMTQPATLDENGEWVQPKVFHPSDLDLPVEEPSEPEDVEITIPDSVMSEIEEYIPLPVYPIVEPEIEEL